MQSRLKIHAILLITILLSLPGLRGQDTLGHYTFSSTSLAPEPGYIINSPLTLHNASAATITVTPTPPNTGITFFLSSPNSYFDLSLNTLHFSNIQFKVRVRNNNPPANTRGWIIECDTGAGFIAEDSVIFPTSGYTTYVLNLPPEYSNLPSINVRLVNKTNSSSSFGAYSNVIFDDLVITGSYDQFFIETINPPSGPAGTTVKIKGSGFSGLTSATYESIPCNYQVDNDSLLELTIPITASSSKPIRFYGVHYYDSPQIFNLLWTNGSCYGGSNVIISELCDPASQSQFDRYIEIFNPTNQTINLNGWEVHSITNTTSSQVDSHFVWQLFGNILPGEAKTCGSSDAVSGGPHSFPEPGWNSLLQIYVNWQGQDHDGAALYDNTGTLVDSFFYANPVGGTQGDIWSDASMYRNSNICDPDVSAEFSQWTVSGLVNLAGDPPATPRVHTVNCQSSPFTWNAQPQNDSICSGEDLQFGASINGSGYTLTYQWYMNLPGDTSWTALSNSGVINGANDSSLVISPAGPSFTGAQFYCEINATAINCGVSSRAARAVLKPAPIPVISNDTALCEGESVTLMASGGGSYDWNTADTTSSISVSPSSNTTYTVTITGTNGCSASDQVTVTVNPLPVISITPDTSVCAGDSIRIGAFISKAQSYLWSTGDNTDSITVGSVNSTYAVTVTDGKGCQADSQLTITELSLPNVNMTHPTLLCVGNTVPVVGLNAETYFWNDSVFADTFYLTLKFKNPIKVIGTAANGCSNEKELLISADTIPTIDLIASSDTICKGESVTIIDNGDGLDHQWSNTSINNSQITATPNQTKTFYLQSSYDTLNGTCPSYDSITIVVNPLPSLLITPTQDSICEGESLDITASGAGSFLWGDGSTNATINVSPTVTTNYTVTITNTFNCTDTGSVTVRVDTVPVLSTSPDTNICEGESIDLVAYGNGAFTWYNGTNTPIASVSPIANSTYTVVLSNSFGCKDSADIQVRVDSLPLVTISPGTSICQGDSVLITAAGGDTYLWSNGDQQSAITVHPADTSGYTVTVSNSFGCENLATTVVNVIPNPVLVLSNDTSICEGESVSLIASGGTSYIWDNGAQQASIQVNPLTDMTYSVTVSNPQNCIDTGKVSVSVDSIPFLGTSTDTSICFGESITLQAFGTGDFLWSNGSTSPTLLITPSSDTIIGVSLSNSYGCKDSSSIQLGVDSLPIISLSPESDICNGGSVLLTASGGDSYLWSSGSTQPTISVNPTDTTDYSVTVSNSFGCESTANTRVNVIPDPVLTLSGDTSICEGDSILLYASGGAYYSWSQGSTTPTITVNPQVTQNFSVTISDTNGCTANGSVQVVVDTLPIVQTTPDSHICFGDSISISASGGASYSWSTGEVTAGITVNPVNSATYIVTVTSIQGCQATGSIDITLDSIPLISVTPDTSICQGQGLVLNAAGGNSFTWSSGDVTPAIFVTPSSTTTYEVSVSNSFGCSDMESILVTVNQLPTVDISASDDTICESGQTTITATGATSYFWNQGLTAASSHLVSPTANTTYSVTGTDGNGCTGTDEILIKVNPRPAVSIVTIDSVLCAGEQTALTANGANSYVWDNGLPSGSSHFVSPLSTTTYSVTGTDTNGCTNTDDILISVDTLPSVSVYTADSILCEGEQSMLTASGASTFIWGPGPYSGSTYTVSPTTSTFYTVTGTDGNGCSATDGINVQVNPLPTVIITATDSAICEGDSTVLTASGASSYLWNTGPGNSNSQVVAPASTASYMVTGTDANGCENSTSITVQVNSLPAISLSANTISICKYDSATLNASGANSYQWNTGTGSGSSQVVAPLSTASYMVTGTDTNGCSDTASISISVNLLPQLSLSPPPPVCIDAAPLSLAMVNPAGGTYSGSGISANLFDPAQAGIGTHNILYSYIDINGCSADTAFPLEVEELWRLEGGVYYDNDLSRPMADSSRVLIQGSTSGLLDSMDLQGGMFSFRCLGNDQYTLEPGTDYKWGGVNSNDALLAARYSVGQVSLNPLRLQATDVNMSGFVNAADALLILRRFVGLSFSFPLPDWVTPSLSLSLSNATIDSIRMPVICAGDANGSYVPGGNKKQGTREIEAYPLPLSYPGEGQMALPLLLQSPEPVGALSLRLQVRGDGKLKEIEGLPPGAVWRMEGNVLNIAWYSLEASLAGNMESICQLVWEGEAPPALSLLPGSAFGDAMAGDIEGAKLRLGVPASMTTQSRIWPNPSTGSFMVETRQKTKENTTRWTILDLSGSVLYRGSSSEARFRIETGELSAGIYVLSLNWRNGDAMEEEHHRLVITR